MTSYSALSPVSAGVYAALNVAAVTALATGGVGDDIGQRVTAADGSFATFVLYEVSEKPVMHMGSQAGRSGQLPELDLLVHVFTQFDGMSSAQAVMNAVIGALVTPPTVSGYSSWAIFHDETIPLGDQLVAGLKVKELVARFRLFVELS